MMLNLMKNMKWLLLILPLSLYAQNSIEEIKSGINTAQVDVLSAHFDESLEIITPDSDGVYSQNQAKQVLKAFFKKYPSSGFSVNHTGNSAGGSKFLVGTYQSGNNSFRVSVFLKKVGNDFLIQELSFEE